MPLKAAKEHLPQDIINILELLGKADNIPFNQLYNLAEDCADRYYTKVIKTLTQLLKGSINDRQIVLVNMARALKFLESYRNKQTKLLKVLSKYDKLPDHFHDLQTTLQTEFNLLKKATSKNFENLHDAIHLQQSYSSSNGCIQLKMQTDHSQNCSIEQAFTWCIFSTNLIFSIVEDA